MSLRPRVVDRRGTSDEVATGTLRCAPMCMDETGPSYYIILYYFPDLASKTSRTYEKSNHSNLQILPSVLRGEPVLWADTAR